MSQQFSEDVAGVAEVGGRGGRRGGIPEAMLNRFHV